MAKGYTSPTFLQWYANLVNSFRGFEIPITKNLIR